EEYVEYSRRGQVIKGAEKRTIRSRYEEDVCINNHTSVWGSYWKDGHWGYKCCHSLIKNSYCTGESGKEANCMIPEETFLHENIQEPKEEQEGESKTSQSVTVENDCKKDDVTTPFQWEKKVSEAKKKKKKDKKRQKKEKRKKKISKSSSSSDSDSSDDEDRKKDKKLKRALKEEEKQQREAKKLLSMDERDRPYNSMYEAKAITEEEMEAYFMKRLRPEDPMAAFLGN
ncbi:pre-mRNA-splicing factor SLU7-like, partial [Limulus polyphemus]|uniref:Pre-mRNA-splicing factor SLU7 n=1 Tax=Limulus polyphemus TaxID=6850 RepID=A0ABM1BXL0_LIMPO